MRIRTKSLIILISRSLQQLATLTLAIILVRIMDKELYGTYRQVLLVTSLLTNILSLNLPASFYYFVPKAATEERRKIVNNLFAIAFAVSAIMSLLLYFTSPYIAEYFNNPPLKELLRIFCLYPFVTMTLQQLPPFFISTERALKAGVYSLLSAVLFTASAVIFTVIGWPLEHVFLGILIVLATLSIIGILDVYRNLPGKGLGLEMPIVKEVLFYIIPISAATIVGVANKQIDKVLISVFFSPAVYAVYSCGAFEIPLIGIITTSLINAIMPNMVIFGKEGKLGELLKLWKLAAQKSLLVIFPSFALLLVCSQDLMIVMYGNEYRDAAWPFIVYLLLLPLRITVYGAVLRAIGKTRPIAIAATISFMVNIVVSITLLLVGKSTVIAFIGPSIGTVTGEATSIIYTLFVISKHLSTPIKDLMPWKAMGRVMSISLIVGIASILPTTYIDDNSLRLIFRTIIFIALLTPVMWAFILDNDDKDMILRFARIILRSRASD